VQLLHVIGKDYRLPCRQICPIIASSAKGLAGVGAGVNCAFESQVDKQDSDLWYVAYTCEHL